MSWKRVFYPGCLRAHWQMNESERLGLIAILHRIKPRCAIEIGTYKGGSLSLISQYAETAFSIDIDPAISEKFKCFKNVSFLTGPSQVILPLLLAELEKADIAVEFVLINGDHSAAGVKRDIEILLDYVPKKPMFVLMHDGFNPECRRGMLEVNWEKSPYVHWVDMDFISGRLIEYGGGGKGELGGGLGMAYFHPVERKKPIRINATAKTHIPHEKETKIISKEDVVNAYRLILGRQPESEQAIESHLDLSNINDLRERFLRSPEFLSLASGTLGVLDSYLLPGTCPPLDIDTTVPADKSGILFDRIKNQWENLGKTEPHWSVITDPKFKQSEFSRNKNEFYASGKHIIELFDAALRRNNINAFNFRSCLELGCGVGRITRFLAERFEKVIALDISESHLQIAFEYLSSERVNNVSLVQLTELDALNNLEKIDVVCSFIVLQHNPPPIMALILRRLLEALNPGGIAFFQVPTYISGYGFSLEHYLSHSGTTTEMEGHVLPQREVFKICQELNCELIEIREDDWIGRNSNNLSNTFLVQKAR
jgi:SAM-dependent methyltransferase